MHKEQVKHNVEKQGNIAWFLVYLHYVLYQIYSVEI